ncbi:dihydroorotate dehydrogenase (fumarate) [Pneumocystis carinii B80]|uniref:Dihydroorotate dehydrogenase (quinone), mitochondrial n=1 Tax=Pneumocystis carinii (strain B80) TaxID=1408658 RepID=A0A0W4ZLN5_PNEC8|nr:dihydroorotate dehydrogenase (fumarate) [Pneumocystis carinii B80]KTW29292.1 dihydroorotate dehydrogenase (fumarate) [Pneumocystis carinii B80]
MIKTGFSSSLLSFNYHPFFFALKRVTTGVFAASFSGLFLYYYTDSRAAIHTYGTCLLLRMIVPPELAHNFAIKAIRWGLAPWDKKIDDSSLMLNVWGKAISNPVGLAAGMDKQAEAIDGLFDLGFGYVEVGSVTPCPQPGNPPPRFFRLKKDASVINRYGFNSDGHDVIARRLHDRILKYVFKYYPDLGQIPHFLPQSARNIELVNFLNIPRSLRKNKLLAVNLGRNKNSEGINDYVKGVYRLGQYADVLVINISSPNTFGLRLLQQKESLETLLSAVVRERDLLPDPKPALCIKISPDLKDLELQDIVDVISKIPIDGVVVSNTTIQRPKNLKEDKFLHERGGLSGPPLKPLALDIIRFLRRKLPENCLIIGCGGISSGKDAIEYARAGASLIQCYTAFGKVAIAYNI